MMKYIRSSAKILIFSMFLAGCAVEEELSTSPPPWAPNSAYEGVYFYYFPDWEIYYQVSTGRWIYYNGVNWIHSPTLPPWFPYINFYDAYRIQLNFYGNRPYRYHKQHRNQYPPRQYYEGKRIPNYYYREKPDEVYKKRDVNPQTAEPAEKRPPKEIRRPEKRELPQKEEAPRPQREKNQKVRPERQQTPDEPVKRQREPAE